MANALLTLQRFAPLMAFAKREAGSLSDNELSTIATALAGEQAQSFVPLLVGLRKAAPQAKGLEILGSPEAAKIYEKLNQQTAADNAVAFCRCPECGFAFETDIL